MAKDTDSKVVWSKSKPAMETQKPMVLNVGDRKDWDKADPRIAAKKTAPLDWKLRPNNKNKKDKRGRPLGGLIIYPAVDPYRYSQRLMFRAIMTKLTWVLRANVIIQKLVCGQSFVTSIEPRKDESLKQSALDSWRQKPIKIPYFAEELTPHALQAWIDKYADRMDTASLWYDAYLYMREQGRCVIGMFPEVREEESEAYQLPETMRIIKPEYTRRPLLNRDTGALEAVEVIGLTSNGGRLDANRAVYFMNAINLDLFGDYYGRSVIDPIEDIGKALLTIYAQDFPQAAQYTWFKPTVWKITVPARDYQNPAKVLDDFLAKRNQSLGRDIAVTQTVEPVFAPANSGDINGVIGIQNELIDAVAGFYNIPPFMLAKGKAGRLGGNANREEIESFLETEIRPEQIVLENTIEKQFYDRILAILYNIEPDEVDDPEKCPVRIRIHFNKPEIDLTLDPTQYKIMKDLATQGILNKEMFIEKLGLRKLIKQHETAGANPDPVINTWQKTNDSWKPMAKTKGSDKWKTKPSWDGLGETVPNPREWGDTANKKWNNSSSQV